MIADLFAFLYWNPPREVFVIPLIQRPIVIYGLCFVAGFILGYFILKKMLAQKIGESHSLYPHDIHDWPNFIHSLQLAKNPTHSLFDLYSHLNAGSQQLINTYKEDQHISEQEKKLLLININEVLKGPASSLTREQLEKAMPLALVKAADQAFKLTDKLTWFVVLGTLIGARLGHVFFYQWGYYQHHLMAIVKTWEGGLASHGGVLGVLIAVFIYQKWILKDYKEISLIGLIDYMVVPSGLVAFFIRIGNFFNQEILGPPTQLPWGVIFGDPVDRGPIVPRHPTQLYEAFAYLLIFIFLYRLWKKLHQQLLPGQLSGLFFILLFTARFFIEFIKMPQGAIIDESFLQMGQYLSLPFILLGLLLFFYGKRLDHQLTVKPVKSF